MNRHTQSRQNWSKPSTEGPPMRGLRAPSHGCKDRTMARAVCSYTLRYCSKVIPPPIHSLLGSFQTHQSQSRTASPPHSSTQLQANSEHCSANQRTARGSSYGLRNLARVNMGVAPTSSTAWMSER